MQIRPVLRLLATVTLTLVLVTGFAVAQTKGSNPAGKSLQSSKKLSVGDAELKRFASTLKDVHAIQIDFQKSFQDAVNNSALGQKKFLQIYRVERSKHKLPSSLSAQEKKQYQQLMTEVIKMERTTQQKMVATVKKDGFTVSRFDAIVRAVHSDQNLANRLKKVR